MYFRPKYYLLASAAFWLLVSCSADDPIDLPAVTGPAMEFSVGVESRSSRADNPVISRFSVFSDMQLNSTSAPLIMMRDTEVTYNQTADCWEYVGTQYWYPDYEHSFVAVHPVSILNAIDADTRYSNNKLSFRYTLPADRKQTADILTATHRRLYKPSPTPADVVMMRFGHVMTQINIATSLNDNTMKGEEYIEFYKLELSGFSSTATFSVTPASLQDIGRTDDRVIEVTDQHGEGNLSIVFTQPVRVVNDNRKVAFLDSDDAIIMLPQAFTADSDAKIILTYALNDGPAINHITIPLESQKWESGKSYTYRFTIDMKGPHFDTPSITDWDVHDLGNIEVH